VRKKKVRLERLRGKRGLCERRVEKRRSRIALENLEAKIPDRGPEDGI